MQREVPGFGGQKGVYERAEGRRRGTSGCVGR